ncbi:MAG: hypothetical protein ACT4TC_19330 [Myxococcaceae bacterium]
MKPRRLPEVRALIAQPEFQEWWLALTQARQEASTAAARYNDLLAQTALVEFQAELTQKNAIDTLYRAGECEDAAANMQSQGAELENRSYRAVSDFEEQRYRASEVWYRLGAAEKAREEKLDASTQEKSRKTEMELRTADEQLRKANDEYQRESVLKAKLWEDVEQLWGKSAEVNLAMAEQRVRGKKIRRAAEALFALAEERKGSVKTLKAQSEAASSDAENARDRVEALLQKARDQFGCSPGIDFLYFRHRDNKRAYCVALVEDHDNYNVELRPLMLYAVDRQRGVTFLEPARIDAPSVEEGDRRFEEYFLQGRKGEAEPSVT